jgi:predicted nucleic acid-binding Zn ribbon protein
MKGVGDRYDRCIRCGTRVPWGRSVCRRCNPADLPSPSPTQYHATVFLVVILSLVLVAGWLILRG